MICGRSGSSAGSGWSGTRTSCRCTSTRRTGGWSRRTDTVLEGFGFFETLGALVLYLATGYLPLNSTANFKFPVDEENAVVERLMDPELLRLIRDQSTEMGQTQAPDNLMYAPDFQGLVLLRRQRTYG